MKSGEVTVERYASALLERCAAFRGLNAFITLEPERVLQEARALDLSRRSGSAPGSLFGLPIPVKDSVNTKDYRTTGGTGALRNFQPKQDAPLVTALRQAGAIVQGKTNLHELSMSYTSDNFFFGAVHNPYDPTRIPGGSSGGSAVAVAARMAPLSVAEDTEGSIRVPAALCGIVGFRPTTGRYPTQGVIPATPVFDQLGPHALHASDLALFDSVFRKASAAPAIPSLRGLRLGVIGSFWADLDPQVEQVSRHALERLRAAGVELVESNPPALRDLAQVQARITDPIERYTIRPTIMRYLKQYHAPVTFHQLIAQASPELQQQIHEIASAPDAAAESAYRMARDHYLPMLRAQIRDYFASTGIAAIVFPAAPVPAPRIGADKVRMGGRQISLEDALARNIAPGSTLGLPGLVLPAGLTIDGLPVALEFDARAGNDPELIALAVSLERELGRLPAPSL